MDCFMCKIIELSTVVTKKILSLWKTNPFLNLFREFHLPFRSIVVFLPIWRDVLCPFIDKKERGFSLSLLSLQSTTTVLESLLWSLDVFSIPPKTEGVYFGSVRWLPNVVDKVRTSQTCESTVNPICIIL